MGERAEVQVRDVTLEGRVEGASAGLRGVLAVPSGDGPWPGVVMVHEAFGVTDEMRKAIVRLASAGYLVLMPDLFTEGGARRCLISTFRALTAQSGRPFADIESARRTLLSRDDCTGSIGVIGFCMGGGFALLTASKGFDASSVNYGMMPKELDIALVGACPIVASFGAKDSGLKNAAEKVEASLTRLGIEHDVKEYPNAGHAFMDEKVPGPTILRPLLRVGGVRPDPEAAVDSWRRIESFFTEHLGGGARVRSGEGAQG